MNVVHIHVYTEHGLWILEWYQWFPAIASRWWHRILPRLGWFSQSPIFLDPEAGHGSTTPHPSQAATDRAQGSNKGAEASVEATATCCPSPPSKKNKTVHKCTVLMNSVGWTLLLGFHKNKRDGSIEHSYIYMYICQKVNFSMVY